MYEDGGQSSRYRDSGRGINSHCHTFGQYLGWHAIQLVAGKLLSHCPVTNDWFYDQPWEEWLGRYELTRKDGYWLSDGIDRTPIDTEKILKEQGEDGLIVTGNQDKILSLTGISNRVGRNIVVEGRWHSADNIRVSISSALVAKPKAAKLARRLVREDPMLVWLPVHHAYKGEDEYERSKKSGYKSWIVCPESEVKLDENDPFGAPCANERPHFSKEILEDFSLKKNDLFGRVWKTKQGTIAGKAEAWGRYDKYVEDAPEQGLRFLCSSSLLKKILTTYDNDLLVLINLQHYETGDRYGRESQYHHSVGVVRISPTLDFEYFKGRTNHLYKPRY